jgi:16S rRNA (guanine966-N2)-methyltransferase
MRIISGHYRGKQLHPPKGFTARPTTDMAKEALFNILVNYFDLESISALDLFSGTGSIAYEFASRGCPEVTAVESNPKSAAFIKKTAEDMKMGIQVYKTSVFQFLRFYNTPFDLIFADPPYDLGETESIPEIIAEKKLLKAGGWLIIEHSSAKDFSQYPFYSETRNYGKVHFSIFKKPIG